MVAARRRAGASATPSYTETDVVALSRVNNEPQWLQESRLAAWKLYETMPMPTLADEDWRRTDFRSLRWNEADKITQATDVTLDVVPTVHREPLVGEGEGGTMVFVDGKFLQSAGWEGEVDENSYHIDYETGTVYIGTDPTNHLVEITAFDVALLRTTKNVHGKKSDKKGPLIRGITFTQYAYRAFEIEGYYPQGLSNEADHGNRFEIRFSGR